MGVEKMIADYVNSGMAKIVERDEQRGVVFLGDDEFIPFDDLGYNSELGFYRLSLFPDVQNEAAEQSPCCNELKANLGNLEREPVLVYISQMDWHSGRRQVGWYPGANGPGFYEMHNLPKSSLAPTGWINEVEYKPLTQCPFCGTKLELEVYERRASLTFKVFIASEQIEAEKLKNALLASKGTLTAKIYDHLREVLPLILDRELGKDFNLTVSPPSATTE